MVNLGELPADTFHVTVARVDASNYVAGWAVWARAAIRAIRHLRNVT